MIRRFCTLFLAVAVVTTLSAGGGGTILVDNFNDGDDDGWSHMDLTAGMPWGPASYDASTGSYTLESAGPVPVDDPNVGTIITTWEPSRGKPRFANGSVRGRVRANTPGSTVGFLLRANDQTHTDYGFYGSTSFGTFYIERFDGSQALPQTIIAIADPDCTPFQAGEDWNLEGGVNGNHLWLKAWKVGRREPAAPLLMVKDKTFGPHSGTLICALGFFDPEPLMLAGVDAVQVSVTVDDIRFSPGGK